MAQVMCNITLDVSINDRGQILMAKQGDSKSRLLCVHLTDQHKPLEIEEGASVLLNVSNGNVAQSFRGSVRDGAALFTIPAFALEQAGTVPCDVSVIGSEGGKLTSAGFEICVIEAVCPDNGLGGEEMPDAIAELLAQDTVYPLAPVAEGDHLTLRPACNRRFTVDLSHESYKKDGAWLPLQIQLPAPVSAAKENWLLLYCYAPETTSAGAVVVDWKGMNALFENGEEPHITMGAFDVVCTFSPAAKAWQVGVIQYRKAGTL